MDSGTAQYLPWQADVLQHALELKRQQRLPHAVMIDTASTRDIGDFARYFASLMLCDDPRGVTLCGDCEACRLMRAGTYADFSLVTLEPDEKTKKISKNIKIEQIRNLIYEVNLTRNYERLKIGVIYPAEAMSIAGANALLKTLEEPAPRVLLILLTHNRGRIPVTLRSRCQSWTIAPPNRSQARAWLTEQGMEASSIETYLDFAQGDPVLAQALEQQDYASLVDGFKSRFARFLRGELGVVDLCRELRAAEVGVARLLLGRTINAYCLRSIGIDADGKPASGADRKAAQALLELRLRAQNQLRVEENNLDFQLQIEDVLISLKQILARRSN